MNFTSPMTQSLLLLIAFGLIGNGAPQTVAAQDNSAQSLTWKLATGDQFIVESSQQSTTTTTVSKRTTQIESSTTLQMDWTVTAIDDDQNAIIDQSITAIKLSVGNPAVPTKILAFDTESKTKPSRESAKLLKQIKPLIGLKFIITLSPRGQIIAAEVPEATSTVLQELPESLTSGDLFSETGLQELIGSATVVLPGKELSVDTNWETVDTFSHPFGTFTRTRNYKLDGISQQNDSEIAAISLETTLEPKNTSASETSTQSTGKPVGQLNSFHETGSLKFDINEGFFQSAETSTTTQTEIPYSETKIETTIENSSTMTITKR